MLKIIKFRLGCQRLPIVALRHNNVPRAQRLCGKCASGALGDEQHLLFECPFVACVRAEYAHLFTPGCTTLEFMQQRDIRGVACFILACLKIYLAPTVPKCPLTCGCVDILPGCLTPVPNSPSWLKQAISR